MSGRGGGAATRRGRERSDEGRVEREPEWIDAPEVLRVDPGPLRSAFEIAAGAAFVLFVFLLPSAIAPITIAAALCCVLTVAAWLTGPGPRWMRNPVDVPALAWLAALVVVAWFSLDRSASFSRLGKAALPALVAVAAFNASVERRGRRALAALLLATIGVSIAGFVGWVADGATLEARARGPAGHYMTFGGQLMLLVSLATGVALWTGRWRWRALALAAALAGALALAATFTRSAWLGLATALAILVGIRKPRWLLGLAVAAGLLVAVVPDSMRDRLWSAFDPHHPTNVERTHMWDAGIRMFRDHPITGVGLQDLHQLYDRYRSPESREPAGHLHSVYIQLAAATGLVGLAAFAFLMFGIARAATKGVWRQIMRLRHATDPKLGDRRLIRGGLAIGVRLGVVAGLAGFLVAGLFEWNFGDEELLYLLYTLTGLAWAARQWETGTTEAVDLKVALVHDWLTGMRGGERVLERIAERHPDAPIYTLVWKRGSVSRALESHPIRTSFLQHLPGAEQRYRWFLPLFPAAIESFDLGGYDVVISTSHAVAKGVRVAPDAFHLSYIHTPMRYVWELEEQYFPPGRFPWPLSSFVRSTCARIRRWDVATAGRAHALLANSAHVAARIRRHWDREAEVVHPPVDVERFAASSSRREAYLLAGAFAPYKRSDLALDACARLGRPLVMAGSGQEERALRRRAGPDVEFRGWVGDADLVGLYGGARALIFPGEEDFGIVPVEAMASGCPVIAFGKGGALETVGRGASPDALARVTAGGVARVPGGVLFGTQSVDAVVEAMRLVEAEPLDPAALRERAGPFSTAVFDRAFSAAFEREHQAWRARAA